jgi:hypothetical protein
MERSKDTLFNMDVHGDIDEFLAHGQELVLRLDQSISDLELQKIRSHLHILDLRIGNIENARKLKKAMAA